MAWMIHYLQFSVKRPYVGYIILFIYIYIYTYWVIGKLHVKPHPPLMFWDSHSLGSAVRSPARHHGQVYARHEEEGGEGQGNTMDFHDGFHGGETWDETRWMTKRW